MTLHGKNRVGAELSGASDDVFHAIDPATGGALEPAFHTAGRVEIERAFELAREAFRPLRSAPPEQRARFFEIVADEVKALGDALVERAASETALPQLSLKVEHAYALSELRMFAAVSRKGFDEPHLRSADEMARALEDFERRTGVPAKQRDGLQTRRVSIGPVVVLGAASLPISCSAVGSDAAAALACACPVVLKAHPSHPGTSELLGEAVARALHAADLPAGAFSMLHGGGAVARALAAHPAARAIAFTGSRAAERALRDVVASRARPIPLYAQVGGQSPLFVLPAALASHVDAVAEDLFQSASLGAGQSCTRPGVVFLVRGAGAERVLQALKRSVDAAPDVVMLNAGIAATYRTAVRALSGVAGVEVHGDPEPTGTKDGEPSRSAARAVLAVADSSAWLREPRLREEVFGPLLLIVLANDAEELLTLAEAAGDELDATLHAAPADGPLAEALSIILEEKVARLRRYDESSEPGRSRAPYRRLWPERLPMFGPGRPSLDRFLRPVALWGFSPSG